MRTKHLTSNLIRSTVFEICLVCISEPPTGHTHVNAFGVEQRSVGSVYDRMCKCESERLQQIQGCCSSCLSGTSSAASLPSEAEDHICSLFYSRGSEVDLLASFSRMACTNSTCAQGRSRTQRRPPRWMKFAFGGGRSSLG